MTNNYRGVSTNEKIIDIYNKLKNGSLILKPRFQRNLVWNDKHKENFIQTILLNLPFPEVYFCDGKIELKNKNSKTNVVDGQQRLNAIYNYINGDIKCFNIKTFDSLTDKEKTTFYNYRVVVRDLQQVDNNQIKDIFKRINSVNYALNATEIHNALYEGEFINVAKKISQDKSLDKLSIFRDSQISRMKDIELILVIMSTIEINGYFTRSQEVEGLIQRYDNKYPSRLIMKKNLIGTFNLLSKINLENDSMWFRVSNFFTLIVELIKFNNEFKKQLTPKKLKEKLVELEKSINKNKTKDIEKNIYAKYYYYVYQATASKNARIYRGKIVADLLRK